jgi:alpha-1,2-mannosyltransferase
MAAVQRPLSGALARRWLGRLATGTYFTLGAAAFLAVAGIWMAWSYLLTPGPDQLLIDLDVYREAGRSVLVGRPVYEWLTQPPQLLPFTYPPISALLATPLTLVPWGLLGWVWTAGQMVLLAGVVAVAYRPLLERFGRWWPIALGVLAGALQWLLPLEDGIRFGQVDIILVALCFADVVARNPRWPRGLLIGIATGVKLTPGVFLVFLLLCGRRRDAMTATVTAAGLTLGAFLVVPADSVDYWFGSIFNTERLGSNDGTSNQALRGMLIRWGVESTLPWLAVAAVVAVLGFRYAVRVSRRGDGLAACAIVGLLAVLLSPVAWIHHLAWVVLVLAVVVRDGRSWRRVALAAGIWVYFTVALPWQGAVYVHGDSVPWVLGRIVQDAYGLLALALLPLLDRLARHDSEDPSCQRGRLAEHHADHVRELREVSAAGAEPGRAEPHRR